MIMASMVATDETALICDFAETYHILDYKGLPLRLAAALASGLRDGSRIKMAMSGATIGSDTALLAAAVDRLSLLVWSKTKDAEKNRNKPKSMLAMLLKDDRPKDDLEKFDTAEEFEAARKRIIQGGG
ncbi:MAG: hypothetical protein IJ896_10805 [Fibrobacter sp.]|nr:hypothetical protein [Fibrobacter sp.]